MNSYHDWYGDGPLRRPRRSWALAAFFLFFHLAPINNTTVAQQQHQQQVHIHIHDENDVHLPSAPTSSDDNVGGGDFLDLHPPPPPPPHHAAGQDVRSYLLTQARKAAEAVQNPGPNDELSRVATEIKELKQQIQRMNETSTTTGSTTITPTTATADIGMMKERLRELEQRRILLLRQGMLKHQFQMPPEQINSELV